MSPRCTTAAAILLAVIAIAGCVPRDHVWWSPDGSVAAVAGSAADGEAEGAGLRLMSPSGELSAEIVSGEISGASWLPDGSGLVVTRRLNLATWQEAADILPAAEVETVEKTARMAVAIASVDAVQDVLTKSQPTGEEDLDPFRGVLEAVAAIDAIMVCARDRHPAEVQEAIKGMARRSEKPETKAEAESQIQEARVSVWEMTFVPIAGGALKGPTRPLVRTLRPLSCPAVSPETAWAVARAAADMRVQDGQGIDATAPRRVSPHRLFAVRLEGGPRVELAKDVVSNPVWLSDGRTVVFATAQEQAGGGPAGIHVLQRVCLTEGPDGTGQVSDAVPLALGVFAVGARGVTLAGLPGDRVLFGSVEATLPSRIGSDGLRTRLFILDAASEAVSPPVPVPAAAGALPDALGSFAVSPDGTRAAVVEWNHDAVVVVDLTSGHVDAVAEGHPEWQCGTLPSWRTSDELLIETLPDADSKRSAWAIHECEQPSGKSLRWLSDGWTQRDRDTLLWNRVR